MTNHVNLSIDEMLKKRERAILQSFDETVISRVDKTMDDVLTKREDKFMQAVVDVVKERTGPPTITVSPAPVTISPAMAPNVVVQMDMKPVADAIAKAFAAINQSISALAALIETLRPVPVAPIAPPQPREPRKITITHDDGSKSVVKEE